MQRCLQSSMHLPLLEPMVVLKGCNLSFALLSFSGEANASDQEMEF